jgi:hypothetical protein
MKIKLSRHDLQDFARNIKEKILLSDAATDFSRSHFHKAHISNAGCLPQVTHVR